MIIKIIEVSNCICGELPIVQKRVRGRMMFMRCLRCSMYGDDALTEKGCATKWNKKIFKMENAKKCLGVLGDHLKQKKQPC